MFARRFLAFLLCCLATSAYAAETLGILTGPKTGTYIAVGRDIAAIGKQAGVDVQVKTSDGSIDNIRRLNSNEKVALGIVQSDVLSFLARSKNAETVRMAEHVRMLFPLYREEVHVLAREGIQSFEELEGKKVVIGEDGSGHMLTSINLFAMSGVTPAELIKKSPPEGVLQVLDGKADAVIFVGGKPVRLFKNLDALKRENNGRYQELLSGLHFLPLKEPHMLEQYQTGEITHKDYSFVVQAVPTIAVTAVLVDYDFSGNAKHQAKCHAIFTLAEALRKNIKTLQAKGHPKWKEVRFDDMPPIWKKDSCAWSEQPAPAPAKPAKKHTAKKSHKHAKAPQR